MEELSVSLHCKVQTLVTVIGVTCGFGPIYEITLRTSRWYLTRIFDQPETHKKSDFISYSFIKILSD